MSTTKHTPTRAKTMYVAEAFYKACGTIDVARFEAWNYRDALDVARSIYPSADKLFIQVVHSMSTSLELALQHAEALQAQRDELVAALRAVMEMIGCECDCIYSDSSNPVQCPCKTARAALAKVQA